ncbi:putative mitochondrial adrenodoxin-like protein,ferredoxin, 2fe-2s-like protein [Leptomonas pyrrhocoris]|uniref:Putative mitochondrial adrenodoxin-like protein,ferredoxin, 2fe-2s-like protein n=1 Tax=Leptomonas pyrrhocoris TaxID=157538 RepID=A0A0N0VD65_LEPPY|nr:putative mitochondrial adrenodoxin-like protein,ferredoxin, 2fe-2s-like protein [Leptomonas pyrrhocoris]KPA74458.1 putative mitochondrial adrenodoxin-like protein,ferredoxin, 2fe-2s-like protein [Leptomonas pyrrhocoris]|eukprot:XP_015652897.1 putative mitochondrial adrenodoxin-like protein,ferredoxin, 2fe-2s-like protein [Leptomonas pyrrhocoris]
MRRWCLRSRQRAGLAGAANALTACTLLYSTRGKVKVHVKTRDGMCQDIDAPVGITLMEALRDVAKLDVAGSCNGNVECGTCHVHLSEASFEKTPAPSEREVDLLAKALEVLETSRLSCQVVVSEKLDGLEVELPTY